MSNERTYVIAEAGVNHGGRLDTALALVEAAAAAGADAVKFQTFVPEALVSGHTPKAAYQQHATGKGSQLAMLRQLALTDNDHVTLAGRCRALGIAFLSSPFDPRSATFLIAMGLKRLKLGSGELTNAPLLLRIARSSCKLILSTGMATLEEVEEALGVLAFGYTNAEGPPGREAFRRAYADVEGRNCLRAQVTLLHCTTEYPCPFEDVNLRAMGTLQESFGLPVGLSDHTPGYSTAVAATALGAAVIEKHFTLDRRLPGPDHAVSLEPDELRAMVEAIRAVECALGDGRKRPAPSEWKNIPVARKVLVASRPITQGEAFGEENLAAKRAGAGLSPMHFWDIQGRRAPRDFAPDEAVVL
ncbi:N,N'-diacetyllegionaminic acid synthase [Gammaproteobacteria bacterium]